MRHVFVVAVIAACAPPPGARLVPHYPAQMPATPDAFGKVTRALVVKGLEIKTSDKESGIIATEWVQDRAGAIPIDGGRLRRMRWMVTIDETFVTVTSQCQTIPPGDPLAFQVEIAAFEDCEGQPQRRNEEAEEIASAVAR